MLLYFVNKFKNINLIPKRKDKKNEKFVCFDKNIVDFVFLIKKS